MVGAQRTSQQEDTGDTRAEGSQDQCSPRPAWLSRSPRKVLLKWGRRVRCEVFPREVRGLYVRFVFVLAYEPMPKCSADPGNDTEVDIRRMLHLAQLTVVPFALLASMAATRETPETNGRMGRQRFRQRRRYASLASLVGFDVRTTDPSRTRQKNRGQRRYRCPWDLFYNLGDSVTLLCFSMVSLLLLCSWKIPLPYANIGALQAIHRSERVPKNLSVPKSPATGVMCIMKSRVSRVSVSQTFDIESQNCSD